MTRTEITYGQLDKALRSFGFRSRIAKLEGTARVYDHDAGESLIVLPIFPDKDRVLDYHLIAVQTMLDNFGIAGPSEFAAQLLKAG